MAVLDLNTPRDPAVQALHDAIDAVPPREDARRTYIGASAIGGPCDRRIQWDFLGEPHDAGWRYSARTLRIFERGHLLEAASRRQLEAAGFRFASRGLDFETAGGAFAGHVDGVIISGPVDAAYPCIWEHKAVGAKSWAALNRNGVGKAKPEYAVQIAIYQAYLDLPAPALFQAVNTDTMEIHFEWVPFDRARAQAASDRAAALIADSRAGFIRPPPAAEPAYFCSDCSFRARCWS